jgi:type II secretory ATPase GspE/PulE/Tfp pilus assembly ATPase PilB-like protein
MGIDPFLVSSALTLAVAQRLYRTICEDCKSYIDSDIVWERLHEEGISQSRLTKMGLSISGDRDYAVGNGCPKCRGTGYFGRRALFEMFNVTQEAKNLLTSKDFTESGLKKLATEQGMSTLLHGGRRAVELGMTTIEEIIRVCGEE